MPTKTWVLTDVTNRVYVERLSKTAKDGLALAGSNDWSLSKHRLSGGVSDGVDVIELHNGRPILYGTGDLINDYEGLPVPPERAAFCTQLGTIAFADFSPLSGACVRLLLCPTRLHRMRVQRADGEDPGRLAAILSRESARFGTRIENRDGLLAVDCSGG